MSSALRKGGGGSGSQRNYKYRRLSSTEKGSGICYSSGDEDEEIFSQGTEVIKLNCRSSSVSKSFTSDSPSKSSPDYEQLVDRPIKHGETLTGLALKYRIPVAELKRINKIIQEKEFYALKSLKIPVKANSLLAEVLQQEQCEDECASASVATTRAAMLGTRSVSSCSEYESDSEMHVGYISIDRILRDTRTKKEAKRFLDSMQKDLANIREKSNSYKSSLDEVAAVLRDPRFQPLARHKGGCSGADWGISWWRILLFGTLLLVGIPFFVYVILSFQNK